MKKLFCIVGIMGLLFGISGISSLSHAVMNPEFMPNNAFQSYSTGTTSVDGAVAASSYSAILHNIIVTSSGSLGSVVSVYNATKSTTTATKLVNDIPCDDVVHLKSWGVYDVFASSGIFPILTGDCGVDVIFRLK